MALTEEQFNRLKFALEQKKKEEGPNYFQRLGESFQKTALDIGAGIEKSAEMISRGTDKAREGDFFGGLAETVGGITRAGLRGAGGFSKIALSPLSPLMEAPGIKQATEFVGGELAKTAPLQVYAQWAGKYPDAAKDIENVLDITALFGVGKTVQTGLQGVKTTVPKFQTGLQGASQKVAKLGEKVKGITEPIIAETKRLPSRISANVAQKQVVQQSINKLPSKAARQAAQDGLDIADIKTIYSIPKTQKAPLKKLATVVKDFAEGKTKTNPIEVVGKPIVNRIKQLNSELGKVGHKLGSVADDLGTVSPNEAFNSVFNELRRIPGLSGLKAVRKGKKILLKFNDTVLVTGETLADRNAIQSIFTEAIKGGTGKSKHLLRQELFEALGGKKTAKLALTDTQEKAYQAIRTGLSNLLEGKNSSYKALSSQYRKIAEPLAEMRKFMKNVAGAEDDILDMSAGLLARRITSNAVSNPQIRNILRKLDQATKVAGKTKLSVENLQDFYNILEKYYDIAPKTGFQSQVRQGVEKAIGGPMQFIGEQFKSYLGETPIVRQKALEKILQEVLK